MSESLYTEIIIDEGKNPQNHGTIENPDISHHDSNPTCGDQITLQMSIKDELIADVKWHRHTEEGKTAEDRNKNCTICMACTSVLTQMIKGKDLDYARNLKKEELLSELGLEYLLKQSPIRIKCALLSLKVLKFGLYSYLAKKLKDSSSLDNLKEEAAHLY
ncbi:MAG: iron-sulfur cluster assembly scaffold protein [Thaumarchaeota archaeon]|nr:iron-sulfur cluster assembly scaffold protein [Nitrososphaerota archaeon]